MRETANALIAILEREYAIYEKLNEISAKKTNVIVGGDVGRLDEIVKVEEQLIVGIGKFEQEREALIEQIANTLQKPVQALTLSDLDEELEEPQTKQIASLQQRMGDIFKALDEKNKLNAQLLQHSLDYIQFSLNLLSGQNETAGVYGKSGEDVEGTLRHWVNKKA